MPRRTAALSVLIAAAVTLPGCQRDRSAARPSVAPATRPAPTSSGAASTGFVRDGDGDPFLRRADGRIVRVPDVDKVVIDLGVGDSVSQGMTFEVYSSDAKVPAAGVAGKATVEVVRVMPGYSECRVIRRPPGVGINIGDLVVNNRTQRRPPE